MLDETTYSNLSTKYSKSSLVCIISLSIFLIEDAGCGLNDILNQDWLNHFD